MHFAHSRSNCGVTLIELLVAASIMALAITAVGAVLAGGIRAWQTVRNHLRLEAGALLGLAIWERDLMNAEPIYHASDYFRGGPDGVTIPLGLPVPDDGGNGPPRLTQPGFVRYAYDPDRRAVTRMTWIFGETPLEAGAEHLVENVESLAITYLRNVDPVSGIDPAGGAPVWEDRFTLPGAVRLALGLSVPGAQRLELERTIILPRVQRGGN